MLTYQNSCWVLNSRFLTRFATPPLPVHEQAEQAKPASPPSCGGWRYCGSATVPPVGWTSSAAAGSLVRPNGATASARRTSSRTSEKACTYGPLSERVLSGPGGSGSSHAGGSGLGALLAVPSLRGLVSKCWITPAERTRLMRRCSRPVRASTTAS